VDDVAVVDDADDPVAPGEEGVLPVRGVPGVSLFSGYLDDAAATKAEFTDDRWFRTGDRVREDVDDTLWFVERDKDVLNAGGENVGAPEIERVLLGVPGVREAAVVGRPDHMLGEVPVGFVLSDNDEETVRRAAGSRCAVLLPSFKQQREIHVVRTLLRSTLDKVAKAQLRRLVERPGPDGG
jgi:crotonobetaine/carnitine-CoA ligase